MKIRNNRKICNQNWRCRWQEQINSAEAFLLDQGLFVKTSNNIELKLSVITKLNTEELIVE